MPKMTRKQVAEFVDNNENWKIIPGNEYIKLGTLDYGSLHYAVVFCKTLINAYECERHGSLPKYEWRRDHYFEYDPGTNELKSLTYSVSNTLIKDKIYEEAKKNEISDN